MPELRDDFELAIVDSIATLSPEQDKGQNSGDTHRWEEEKEEEKEKLDEN